MDFFYCKHYKLKDSVGEKGTVIMFICNQCPYVKAIIEDLVKDINDLINFGIK